MLTKPKSFIVLTIVTILAISTAIAGASGIINALDPKGVTLDEGPPPIGAPRLIIPNEAGYIAWPLDTEVTAPDGRPIAQLVDVPANLARFVQDVSVSLPDIQPTKAGVIGYTILSSVRYEGNDHLIFITTARPSPEAAKQSTVFGNQTTQLSDGSIAWTTDNIPDKIPNQVVFVRDELIVTIASSLPLNDLKVLGEFVIVVP